jgi:hypothetical protein
VLPDSFQNNIIFLTALTESISFQEICAEFQNSILPNRSAGGKKQLQSVIFRITFPGLTKTLIVSPEELKI